MEEFIHRENLLIFKRRLAEAKNDAQRQMLLKLLAEEEAKGGPLAAGARHAESRATCAAEVTSIIRLE